jgi:hypothetical protein
VKGLNTRTRGGFGLILAAGVLLALAVAGCSSKEKKAEQPMTLVPLVNRIEIKRLWGAQIKGEMPRLRLGLGVAVSGQRAFVASYKGEIEAFDIVSGQRLWHRSLRVPLSGGPGAAAGMVVIGTLKGEVIALSDQDGSPRWRTRVNAEILAAPAVDADLVAVRSVDGRLHGLSAGWWTSRFPGSHCAATIHRHSRASSRCADSIMAVWSPSSGPTAPPHGRPPPASSMVAASCSGLRTWTLRSCRTARTYLRSDTRGTWCALRARPVR